MTTCRRRTRARSAIIWALRSVLAGGLVVDAVIHLRLAGEYEFAFPEGIGGGALFQLQAGVALVAALAVLVWGRRPTYWFATLVASSAFVAVVAARYVELPAVGPLPSMYEPLWFFQKSLSAVAELIAALSGLSLLLLSPRGHRRRMRAAAPHMQDPSAGRGYRRSSTNP